jgi:hypothetical protein
MQVACDEVGEPELEQSVGCSPRRPAELPRERGGGQLNESTCPDDGREHLRSLLDRRVPFWMRQDGDDLRCEESLE